MSRQVSILSRRRYGLARACLMWEVARSGLYAWRARAQRPVSHVRRRPGPQGPCSDEDLVKNARQALQESPFHGEGYRKVWARLRFKGIRTSKERVRRLMREHGLQAPHRVGRRRGPVAHDGTITTKKPNEMWGTDMTATVTTDEGQAAVMVAVDHCSFECVGIHASKSANRFEALEPVRQAVAERLDEFGAGAGDGLAIRHDHGTAYLSDTFQNELAFLGIASSPAFIREPEGNGCAERFIRILKENLLWVQPFANVEELRQALHEFKDRYNREWILERHAYMTPRKAAEAAALGVAQAA